MKFSLRNILEGTAFIAVLLSLASLPYSGPFICILFVHIGAVGAVITLGFWTILTGKQKGTQLETTTPIFDGILLRFAAYCGLATALFWGTLFCAWAYSILRYAI